MSYYGSADEVCTGLGLPLLVRAEASLTALTRHERLSEYAPDPIASGQFCHRVRDALGRRRGTPGFQASVLWLAGPSGTAEQLPWAVGLADQVSRQGLRVYLVGEQLGAVRGHSVRGEELSRSMRERLGDALPPDPVAVGTDVEGVRWIVPRTSQMKTSVAAAQDENWFVLLVDSFPEFAEPIPPHPADGVVLVTSFRDHSQAELSEIRSRLHSQPCLGVVPLGPTGETTPAASPTRGRSHSLWDDSRPTEPVDVPGEVEAKEDVADRSDRSKSTDGEVTQTSWASVARPAPVVPSSPAPSPPVPFRPALSEAASSPPAERPPRPPEVSAAESGPLEESARGEAAESPTAPSPSVSLPGKQDATPKERETPRPEFAPEGDGGGDLDPFEEAAARRGLAGSTGVEVVESFPEPPQAPEERTVALLSMWERENQRRSLPGRIFQRVLTSLLVLGALAAAGWFGYGYWSTREVADVSPPEDSISAESEPPVAEPAAATTKRDNGGDSGGDSGGGSVLPTGAKVNEVVVPRGPEAPTGVRSTAGIDLAAVRERLEKRRRATPAPDRQSLPAEDTTREQVTARGQDTTVRPGSALGQDAAPAVDPRADVASLVSEGLASESGPGPGSPEIPQKIAPPPVKETPPPGPKGVQSEARIETVKVEDDASYVVHISSFRSPEQARRELERLRGKGLDPEFVRAEVPKKGTWYRVFVGHFATFQEAEDAAKRLQAEKDLGLVYVVGQGGKGKPIPVVTPAAEPGRDAPGSGG